MVDLLGVSALAAALNPPRTKGTISKHAEAGKIPVAARDKRGAPLFDLAQVQAAYDRGINTNMRREGGAIEGPEPALELDADAAAADDDLELDQPNGVRESGGRKAGELQGELVDERRLRNRRLRRLLAQDEGKLVLRVIVDEDQETFARRTRDTITAHMADQAAAAAAFAGAPRTDAEWRVWLTERTREAFNRLSDALALEDDDEFANEPDAGGTDEPAAGAVA